MSLYRRTGSKFWLSRIEVRKRVYQFSTKTTNKNEARSVEAKFRTDKLKGTNSLGLAPTLSEFSTQFINSLPGSVSPQTYRYYVTHWLPLVNSDLGECRLDRIGAGEIEKFKQWRRKQKVSTTTVNHNLRCLRRATHLAVEWGLISTPPKVRLLPGEHQRDYVVPDSAVDKFAALRGPGPIGKLVPFLVDTGLRRREVCNLRWEDVNTAERWIYIPKGKTKFARRRIPLTSRALAVLESLPRDGEYVFTLNGHGITPDWISHAFLAARRKLNAPKKGESEDAVKKRRIPDECVLHSTRHKFCSSLGEKGADAFAIQRLAGHSSITISQRYVHPSVSRLDATIALLNPKPI